jgi:hypothetical protein
MITGLAIGYLAGVLIAIGVTFAFAFCSFVNAHEGKLSQIYSPADLDTNATNDPTGAKEENGRRTNDNDGPDPGNKDE